MQLHPRQLSLPPRHGCGGLVLGRGRGITTLSTRTHVCESDGGHLGSVTVSREVEHALRHEGEELRGGAMSASVTMQRTPGSSSWTCRHRESQHCAMGNRGHVNTRGIWCSTERPTVVCSVRPAIGFTLLSEQHVPGYLLVQHQLQVAGHNR